MGQRMKTPFAGTYQRECAITTVRVTTSTSGAIASQTGARDAGVTVAKTAGKTGRYTVTADEKTSRIAVVGVILVGAADAALTNTAGGAGATYQRNNAPTTRTVDIQFTRNDTSADAEIPDGFAFDVTLALYLA